MNITDWLVGIGSILAGVASVWTVLQQRQLNKHEERIKDLKQQR